MLHLTFGFTRMWKTGDINSTWKKHYLFGANTLSRRKETCVDAVPLPGRAIACAEDRPVLRCVSGTRFIAACTIRSLAAPFPPRSRRWALTFWIQSSRIDVSVKSAQTASRRPSRRRCTSALNSQIELRGSRKQIAHCQLSAGFL